MRHSRLAASTGDDANNFVFFASPNLDLAPIQSLGTSSYDLGTAERRHSCMAPTPEPMAKLQVQVLLGGSNMQKVC